MKTTKAERSVIAKMATASWDPLLSGWHRDGTTQRLVTRGLISYASGPEVVSASRGFYLTMAGWAAFYAEAV